MASALASAGASPLSRGARAALPARGFSGSAGESRPPPPRGLYEILGVTRSATHAQIKAAYYKQSFLSHPDRNAGSEEAARHFARVSEAYAVLGSVSLRRKYDRGLLSREDLRTAGRPRGDKEEEEEEKARAAAGSRASSPPSPTTKRSPSFGQAAAKPVFDFDKFYRAHYGEQLEREQLLRERRRLQQQRKEQAEKEWRLGNLQELGVAALFLAAVALIANLK